jgi:hypothetical protein
MTEDLPPFVYDRHYSHNHSTIPRDLYCWVSFLNPTYPANISWVKHAKLNKMLKQHVNQIQIEFLWHNGPFTNSENLCGPKVRHIIGWWRILKNPVQRSILRFSFYGSLILISPNKSWQHVKETMPKILYRGMSRMHKIE